MTIEFKRDEIGYWAEGHSSTLPHSCSPHGSLENVLEGNEVLLHAGIELLRSEPPVASEGSEVLLHSGVRLLHFEPPAMASSSGGSVWAAVVVA